LAVVDHWRSRGAPVSHPTKDPYARKGTCRMKLGFWLCLLHVATLSAGEAAAAGANFAWSGCLAEGGSVNTTFACNSNSGTRVAVGSFVVASDHAGVVGIEATVDIIAKSEALPNWWRAFGIGSCRSGLSANFSFGLDPASACTDPWSGQATGGIGALRTVWSSPQVDGHNPATGQLLLVGALPSSSPTELLANTEYYGFKLVLTLGKTVGSTACDGCATPVCLALSSTKLVMSDNSFELLSRASTSNVITWQGAESCPASIAAANRRWGEIRALYH